MQTWTAGSPKKTLAGCLLLLGSLAALFVLPYHVPVLPTVSMSYVAGFNNHAAVAIAILMVCGIAWWTRGNLAGRETHDRQLTASHLYVALILVACVTVVRVLVKVASGEGEWFMSRLQLLEIGMHPWRDFVFYYGPLLLYPVLFLNRILHITLFAAYEAWWVVCWLVGTYMYWYVIRNLPFRIAYRPWLFWILFLQLPLTSIMALGLQYTPLRQIGAPFILTAIWAAWSRWTSPLSFVLLASSGVAGAFLISTEQGVGVLAGVLAGALVATWTRYRRMRWHHLASLVAVLAAFLLLAFKVQMFKNLDAFSDGGYAYPLLPSPSVLLLLAGILVAFCPLLLALRQGLYGSAVIPLACAGAAMLPAGLGRCDIMHIQIGSAFYLGFAFLLSHRSLRLWPLAAAFCLLLVPAARQQIVTQLWNSGVRSAAAASPPPSAAAATPRLQPPCVEMYLAPTLAPAPFVPLRDQCFLPARFAGLGDLLTPALMDREVAELKQHPLAPILLHDMPLDDEFGPLEVTLPLLRYSEFSPFVPRAVHSPLTFEPLKAFIRENYAPDAAPVGGLRIWRRRNASSVPHTARVPS